MMANYLLEHYPNHCEKLAHNPLVATAVKSTKYTNGQIEDIIDKIALFNGIEKV